MKKQKTYTARAYETREEYVVTNIPTTATKEDIINFCDACNFGGYVYYTNAEHTEARVTVDID